MYMEIIDYIRQTPLLSTALSIALILVVSYLINRLAQKGVERFIRRVIKRSHFKSSRDEQQREDTLISILHTGLGVAIWTIAGLLILDAAGVDIVPLLAGAGVVGVALAFGAQSLVKDFLASLFILSENQYRVGDVLQINQGVSGLVEKITLRLTVLRDLDGRVHYIPNGNIELATNMTMEFAQVAMNINVSYDADLDKVESVINEVGKAIYNNEKWSGVVLEAPHMLRVDSFGDSSISVKVVCKTAPIRQWDVKSEILREIKKAFAAEKIEIPLPQRVIHTKKS
ncbi:hypothetical protein B7Z17_00690 [Candidatus Saccharibacteria bacterium 32-49-10]|nr:MAG: hypothetical protein B7Z17_00690 [Candidatus Saccharibacteria bacterium 32-49-10]